MDSEDALKEQAEKDKTKLAKDLNEMKVRAVEETKRQE